MADWKLPWDGGCRCDAVRIPRDRAAAADRRVPLRRLRKMSASAYSLTITVPAAASR